MKAITKEFKILTLCLVMPCNAFWKYRHKSTFEEGKHRLIMLSKSSSKLSINRDRRWAWGAGPTQGYWARRQLTRSNYAPSRPLFNIIGIMTQRTSINFNSVVDFTGMNSIKIHIWRWGKTPLNSFKAISLLYWIYYGVCSWSCLGKFQKPSFQHMQYLAKLLNITIKNVENVQWQFSIHFRPHSLPSPFNIPFWFALKIWSTLTYKYRLARKPREPSKSFL